MRALLLAALLAAPAAAQEVCGRDGPACEIDGGSYRVALPEGGATGPSVLFLHGFGGSARGALGMTGVVEAVTARGYAMVAADGVPREGGGGRRWNFLPEAQRARDRDEGAFLAAVMADAAARYGLDPARTLLAGFSAGGFTVHYIACEDPGAFAAYAPVAGAFWRPHPTACAGPVRLLHTHGWRDRTVPLEGRPLGGGRYVQGDVWESLGLWREANGCGRDDPDGTRTTGRFLRRHWDCAEGSALEMALFDGGHGVPAGWADMALDWFEAVTGEDG